MTTPVEQLAFIPTSANTKRSLGDWTGDIINVKNFGAIGDGVHDDTANIQAALDAAFGPSSNPHDGNTNLNKPVWFPAGSYKITAPLVTTTVRSGRIYGDGMFCTTIAWSGNAFNGNQLGIRTGSTDTGTPNNAISCMWEIAGMARTHISNLQLTFGNNQSNNTAVVYGYGHRTSTQVVWENVCFAGATYGIILGAGSPNGVSEWKFYNCYITLNGQAGVFIQGQNTLNNNFINCSFDQNSNSPITTSFTGSVASNTLTVTAFTSAANNPYLEPGLLIYNASGAIQANTLISSYGSGTGGTGTYGISIAHSSSGTGNITMGAFPPNYASLCNINGSAMTVHGGDFTNSCWDILQGGANPFSITGTRTESVNFIQAQAGTPAFIYACNTANIPATQCTSCTTNGPIVTVGDVGGTFLAKGMYVYGTDGANSLYEGGGNPPVTTILKQLTGVESSAGDYLLSAQPSGNLGSFTMTAKPQFATILGSGSMEIRCCGGQQSVITGSNNNNLRLTGNNFNNPFVNPDLLRGYFGQVLEYDVAGPSQFTANLLPTPHNRFKGVRMFVTDSSLAFTAANVGAAISTGGGGGTNAVPLTCSGSAWLIG